MHVNFTDALCTHCGLCCNGALFAEIELIGAGHAAYLRIMGPDAAGDEPGVGLRSAACPALRGTRCSIYAERPDCCRVFECRLLQNAREGAVTIERAREQIADTHRQIERLRALLAEVGGDMRLTLKASCEQALADARRVTSEPDATHAELAAALQALETQIWNTFLGTGRRGC